jgi:hypothetical protein
MAKPRKKAATVKTTKVNKTTVEAPAANVETPAEAPVADGSQLTIADLQALASVIDIAVRRGAFGAGEVTEVGAIFDKLSSFLAVIAAQKEAADKAAGASLTEGGA